MAASDQCVKGANVETKYDDVDDANDMIQRAQTTVVYTKDTNTNAMDLMHVAAKRKEEIKKEEEYNKIMDEMDADREAHSELSYRPYKYDSTPVTRPKLKNNPDGKGVLYTEYDDEHKFNYFRYWIGRSTFTEFRDDTENICTDLKSVILRDEYDSDNMREDMMIEVDDNESMILNEEEFEKYEWNQNTAKQNEFRCICCHVIDTLPLYKEWIDQLSQYQSTDDLNPRIDQKCASLPCPSLRRLLITFKFYHKWMKDNFNHKLEAKNTFHFSVHDFMDCLEHYNSVEFQNDYLHLGHCHIHPINDATQSSSDTNAFGLNVGTLQNALSVDEYSDDDEEEEKEDDDDKKEKDNEVILDSENRNVYEWFEDLLGECDVEKCAIFERVNRSRYESKFDTKTSAYYALNEKEINECLERVQEIHYQRIFDAMHVILFHTSARFDCLGLGNSEEHRKFLTLSLEKRKEIKSNDTGHVHHRAATVPNKF